jgi:intracellular sulfur oxidation DsrE/DsrF family protein
VAIRRFLSFQEQKSIQLIDFAIMVLQRRRGRKHKSQATALVKRNLQLCVCKPHSILGRHYATLDSFIHVVDEALGAVAPAFTIGEMLIPIGRTVVTFFKKSGSCD